MVLRKLLLVVALCGISVFCAVAQEPGANDSLVRAFFKDTASNKLGRNDFAQSAENAFQLLNGAQTEAALGWKVLEAKDNLRENRQVLRVLRKALGSHTNSGLRNLQLYGNMLEDIQAGNARIREVLDEAEEKLLTSKKKIKTIVTDTVIIRMVQQSLTDTTTRRRGRGQAKKLQQEYIYTTGRIKTSLDSVQRWSAMASFQAITTAELIQKADSIMQQTGVQALKGDCSNLWEASVHAGVVDTAGGDFAVGITGNKKIINYYVRKNIGRILWMPILVFVLFLRWTWRNYKRVKSSGYAVADDKDLRYMRRSRILLALVVSLGVFPLLDVHAPWFYLLMSQCLVMGAVTFFFWEKATRRIVPVWFMLLGLLVAISVTNSFEPDLLQRCALIGLNIGSVVVALVLFPRIRYMSQLPRTVRVVTIVYVLVNVLAIFCNLFGRVIIAEAMTNAAIIGITQIMSLSVFIQAVSEALYLQLLASRIKRNIPPVFEHEEVLKAIHKPLFLFVLLVWGIMFTANLYMYGMIKDGLTAGLKASVSVGSLSFSVGNMLLFFIIIWIAHLLQQYIGSFFGDSESDDDLESKKQRSRMMVIKLVVICLGYLLAVAASGLPLDKITIVLGALGVGVGMGLQNIVNNFVSGVVLIFDRPLQIGDSIEVGPNKGRVKSIGIRSSTLLTPDGAEVIIPNGDILSSPITNWTLSNNQRRVELEFTLKTTESRDTIIDLIKGVLIASPDVVTDREPLFVVEHVTDSQIKLKVFFWCNNINKSDWIRSEVRYQLYGMFHEKGILVV